MLLKMKIKIETSKPKTKGKRLKYLVFLMIGCIREIFEDRSV